MLPFYYFWDILLEFASGIYKHIHNESVLNNLHQLPKNSIWENRHLEPNLMNKVIDEDWVNWNEETNFCVWLIQSSENNSNIWGDSSNSCVPSSLPQIYVLTLKNAQGDFRLKYTFFFCVDIRELWVENQCPLT